LQAVESIHRSQSFKLGLVVNLEHYYDRHVGGNGGVKSDSQPAKSGKKKRALAASGVMRQRTRMHNIRSTATGKTSISSTISSTEIRGSGMDSIYGSIFSPYALGNLSSYEFGGCYTRNFHVDECQRNRLHLSCTTSGTVFNLG